MFASRRPPSAAFTLLELLIVVAIISVLAGIMIPSTNPGAATRLQGMASILGREVEYARSMAVVNSDKYRITFDTVNNQWVMTYSGMNSAFSALPISAFHRVSDPPNQQTVALDQLPNIGGTVRLFAVWSLSNPPQVVSDLEFTPLGGTTRVQPTLIWLATGVGSSTRYISVRVNPVTGLYWVENYQVQTPTPSTFPPS